MEVFMEAAAVAALAAMEETVALAEQEQVMYGLDPLGTTVRQAAVAATLVTLETVDQATVVMAATVETAAITAVLAEAEVVEIVEMVAATENQVAEAAPTVEIVEMEETVVQEEALKQTSPTMVTVTAN